MFNPVNPQEPTPDIFGQLKKHGLKMDKRSKTGNASDPIGNMGNKVSLTDNGNPNSRSSYKGIFGY